MVKVKSMSEDGGPARSLRSRKRNCENPESVEDTEDLQDSEEKDGVVAILQQFPLPACVVVIDRPAQVAEPLCPTKQDPSAKEKHTEATNEATDVHLTTEEVPQPAVTEEAIVTIPNSDSQLNIAEDPTAGDELKNEKDMKKTAVDEYPACTDHLQIVPPNVEEVTGSCEAVLEKPLCAAVNDQSNSEENEEGGQNQPSDSCMSEIKEAMKESRVGVPPKKKRRMGMCGLTEKERNHFLLAQQRDNGLNGTERAERQMNEDAAEKPAEESSPSPCFPSLPPSILEEPQSSHSGDFDSSKTDVHVTATTSGEMDTGCDPEGNICEAEPAIVVSPEEIEQPKPDQLVKEENEEEGGHVESQRLQQSKQSLTESEMPEEQVTLREDEPVKGCCGLESSSQDAVEVAVPPVKDMSETQEEERGEVCADAVSASSADAPAGEISCDSVEISGAAAAPGVSERTDQSDPDTEPAAGAALVTADCQDTSDPFGSSCSDYVSDSQLNTIEICVEKEKESSGHHEDGTNLICGLIRELSSLNRNVMAAHRELEVFHRRGKSSRGFLC